MTSDVKSDRDQSSPYAAMLAAQDVADMPQTLGITALHIKLRATGGNRTKTPGPGAQSALRALARSGRTNFEFWVFFSEHIDARRITNICGVLLFFGCIPCSGLNLLAQISDRIHHFTALNSVHLRELG